MTDSLLNFTKIYLQKHLLSITYVIFYSLVFLCLPSSFSFKCALAQLQMHSTVNQTAQKSTEIINHKSVVVESVFERLYFGIVLTKQSHILLLFSLWCIHISAFSHYCKICLTLTWPEQKNPPTFIGKTFGFSSA